MKHQIGVGQRHTDWILTTSQCAVLFCAHRKLSSVARQFLTLLTTLWLTLTCQTANLAGQGNNYESVHYSKQHAYLRSQDQQLWVNGLRTRCKILLALGNSLRAFFVVTFDSVLATGIIFIQNWSQH